MNETKAVADFKKCGAGREADCCIFLVGGGKGAECARFTDLHNTLAMRAANGMAAQRAPTAEFPACQLNA